MVHLDHVHGVDYFLEKGVYRQIPYPFAFDVQFDLRRKARIVAGGHRTDPPNESCYSTAVPIDFIRLALFCSSVKLYASLCS